MHGSKHIKFSKLHRKAFLLFAEGIKDNSLPLNLLREIKKWYTKFQSVAFSNNNVCRSIHQVAPELDLEHPVIKEPRMDTASKTIGKKTQKIKSREKKSVQIQSNRDNNKNHPTRNSAKDKRWYITFKLQWFSNYLIMEWI